MLDLLRLRFLLATFAGWIHREQAQVVDYLVEENRVLRLQLGDRRLRLTDAQRRRLAARGKALGRSLLAKVATIVTPDTILRWYHTLIAAKNAWLLPLVVGEVMLLLISVVTPASMSRTKTSGDAEL